ncbi:MAG TPA: TonB-dependent receptor [Blastocatellia bacterium]|nr:TonB-dependent receptor [Blastocatellia bacterium]
MMQFICSSRCSCALSLLISFVFLFAGRVEPSNADDLDNVVFDGTVRDTTGAVITGAQIRLINESTRFERSAQTDAEGRYHLIAFEPGRYTLGAEAAGFREESRPGIEVIAGRRLITNFVLEPAGTSEQVNVHASASSPIDVTRTVSGGTIEGRELADLPIANRDPLKLVLLLGGVAEAPLSTADLAEEGSSRFFRGTPEEAGVFSLTGAPATSNNITIDGLDNNDDRGARERVSLGPDQITEVQVITNQYAAEYGRASGGRINLRTRSGSNQLHADGFFQFGDESLNANTYYRNARGLGRIPQQQRRESLTVSGPLKTDRHFFLVGYERLDITDVAQVSAVVPLRQNPAFGLPAPNRPVAAGSTSGLFVDEVSTPEIRNLINVRTDVTLTPVHNATIRFDLVRGGNKRGFPGSSRLIDTILVEGRDSGSIAITDNLVFSSTALNQFRFQSSQLQPRSSGQGNRVGVVIQQPATLIAGAFTGSDSSPAFSRKEKRIQLQDTLTLIRSTHSLKTGADIQLVRSTFEDLFAAGGLFTFETIDEFLSNAPSRFQQRFDTASRVRNNVAGLFVQDEWHVRPNLTLSAGARWDNESVLQDRDNFSPRVAIAWDPFGGRSSDATHRLLRRGTTVIRAGFGIFYNRALLRTMDDFSLGRSSIVVDSDLQKEVLALVRFPQPISDHAIAEHFGVKETSFLRRVSDRLQIPYTLQTGFGIERKVRDDLVANVDYIFTRGAHQWRESNINAPVLPVGFGSFTDYLLSRDFDNRPGFVEGRPISGASADVVRFDLSANTSSTAGAIRTVNGVRVLTLGLNAPRSSNIAAALNAVRPLRPNPLLTQVELLESTGNSFYHGGIFSLRYSTQRLHLRAVYTISKFIDEGTTNTASPQNLRDRRAERALSLQDQRHRIVVSGVVAVPLLRVDFAPVVSVGSSRPFNIGAGFDRNLNDISNDRPNFLAELGRPVWRRPGKDSTAVKAFQAVAPIGSDGNLPRNYGRGPGTRSIDVRVSRRFSIGERLKIRPSVEAFNVFNETVFSFGSEFIDRDDADFLVPRRTAKPRSVLLNLKVEY